LGREDHMTKNYRKFAVYAGVFSLFLLLFSILSFRHFGLSSASGQSSSAEPMIQQQVNDNLRVVLRGNTYPLARPEFDQGPVPGDMPINHRYLILDRPAQQQAALEKFMADQQDPSSANYHRELSPQEYGQMFGPAESDVQAVTAWLSSHGFSNIQVSNSRQYVDFSGIASQFNQAFQISIHYYSVRGEQHWANSTDPSIPAALSSVVVGAYPLHNFLPHPSHFTNARAIRDATQEFPHAFTYGGGCDNNNNCYAVTPGDFAKIYNLTPAWNAGYDGSGVTIAVIGQSNINTQDMAQFRTLFGLNAAKLPVVTCVDAQCPPLENASGDEGESDLDVEWSGSVAPDATINLVTATPTESFDSGIVTAAEYAVDNNVAPIVSLSYDECEADLGTSGNSFFNSLWQQAQGEMITAIVATGDNGATACDTYNTKVNPYSPQPATGGLAVSGLSSTQYNVAVGGTDFDEFISALPYWSSTNTTLNTNVGQLVNVSADGYIPETTWNVSCTNFIFGLAGFSASEETNCNNTSQLISSSGQFNFIAPGGGGGGASTLYGKPSWQVAPGVPPDGHRDVPDVSLFAGNGLNYSFYVVCESDDPNQGGSCDVANANFIAVGGTSASAQVFAGMMALVVQAHGRQGNPNTTLYKLASAQALSRCNSSNSPLSSCTFYDITNGTIAQPCAKGSLNCLPTTGSDTIGVTSGYSSLPGYDFATGLGSVNAANLVNNWNNTTNNGSPDYVASLNPNQMTADASGDTATATLYFLSTNGYTGTINLASANVSGLPQYSSMSFSPDSVTVPAGGTATSMCAISTAGAAHLLPISRVRPLGVSPTLIAIVVLFATLLLFSAMRRQIRWSTAIGVLALGLFLACGACGGGGGGNTPPPANSTPAGIYTGIVISVSDGTTTHTVPVVLNVN
jgi:subtilase family serine protease